MAKEGSYTYIDMPGFATAFARKLGYENMTELLRLAKEAGYGTVREYLKDNITLDQFKKCSEHEKKVIFPEFKG